jgi:hypothetical protein
VCRTFEMTHVYTYMHIYIYTLLFYIVYSPDDGSSGDETCQRNIMLNNGVYLLPNKHTLLEFNN